MKIEYDEQRDVVTIEGYPYAGVLFRALALAEPGTWLRIETRKDGVLTVFQPGDAQGRALDAITGRAVAAFPR